MVKRATEGERREWAALPSRTEIAIRRISSVLLIGGFFTILAPFTPFSWLTPNSFSEGPDILDSFLSPVIVLGALFFQWQIAGIIAPLAIQLADFVFLYQQAMYWKLAFLEVAIFVVVHLGKNEILRRFATVSIVAGLWVIGWSATPMRYKRQAWEHIKWVWMWMAFDEARRVVGRGRRRW
jgi:hypothetical protein